MLLTSIGLGLATLCVVAVQIWNLGIEWVILGSLLSGIAGGRMGMMSFAFASTTDVIADQQTRSGYFTILGHQPSTLTVNLTITP